MGNEAADGDCEDGKHRGVGGGVGGDWKRQDWRTDHSEPMKGKTTKAKAEKMQEGSGGGEEGRYTRMLNALLAWHAGEGRENWC